MRPGLRAPAILLAAATALGAYIVLFERHQPSTEQAEATSRLLVPDLRRADVSRISIERGDKKTAIERTGDGGWRMAPSGAAAETALVDGLLSALETAEVDREVAEPDPATTGLEPPRVVLTVTAGREQVLHLGRTDTSGRGVYVRRAGEPRILVAERRLLEAADKGPDDFRDRRVLPPGVRESKKLTWRSGSEIVALTEENGLWLRDRRRVDGKRVADALRALADLRVVHFSDREAATPPPHLRLTVELDLPAPSTLNVRESGCRDGELLAERLGPPRELSCLGAASVERLMVLLRQAGEPDRRLVALDPGEVTAAVVENGGRRLELEREGSSFKLIAPAPARDADKEAVEAWLSAIAAERTDVLPASIGAEAKGPKLILRSAQREESLVLGSERAGRLRVDRSPREAAVSAGAGMRSLLDADPLRFQSRMVLSFARYEAQRLQVERNGHAQEAVKGDGEVWYLRPPLSGEVDAAVLDKVLGTLSSLKVERYLPAGTAPAPPALTVFVTLEPSKGGGGDAGAPVTYRLEVAASCQGRLTPGDAPVFVLGPDTCTKLRTPLSAASR